MAVSASDPARPLTSAGRDPANAARLPLPSDGTGDDWAAETADAIERLVLSVRGKTIGPLEKLARSLVYGMLALIVGVGAAVLASVMIVRVLDVAIPGSVWSAHAITGGIFCLSGLFLWRKRSVKAVKS